MTEQNQAKPTANRRRVLLIAGTVVFVAAIVSIVWTLLPETEEERPERVPVPVEVSEVGVMTLHETVRGIGTLRAPAEVVVSPESGGRVRTIHFEEGGFVETGEILVELEDEKLRSQIAAREAAVRSAEVRLANARRTFERQEELAQHGVVPEDELDRARAELDSAAADLERFEAELGLAQEQLNDMTIRAPFSGAISERLVNKGAYVAPGDSLARLYQTDPLEIAFSVPERFLGQVARGQEVRVTIAAYPDESFIGILNFVSPSIDESTRTLAIKAAIPNQDGRLSPGAFATAVVTVGERENAPVVPEESLVGTRTGYIIFVIEDGIARLREVRTGLRRDGLVEITEGLQPGERVVRSGHMRLDAGSSVKIVGEPPTTGDETDALAHQQQ
ncbi:MAG: efflux RND transporter periplasmic adaptor subunit [Opitutales bacterium]